MKCIALKIEGDEDYSFEDVPERRLLIACLECAFRDCFGGTYANKHIQRAARQWLHSDDIHLWSFLWMCEQLDMSSTAINIIRTRIPIAPRRRVRRHEVLVGTEWLKKL